MDIRHKFLAISITVCGLLILLFSCASETQKTGMAQLENTYNCKTSFKKEVSVRNNETQTVFNIELSNSIMLDTLSGELTANNAALTIYENFTEEEKETYTDIKVSIKSSSGKTYNTILDLDVLEKGANQLEIFTDFSNNIVDENFEDIASRVNPKFQKETLGQEIANFMANLTDVHGDVKHYQRIGFGSYKSNNQSDLYYFSGFLEFENGYRRNYFINTSQDVNNDYIAGFDLDLKHFKS